MSKIIYAQDELNIKGKSIFLAGPTPRKSDVLSWRPKAIKMISQGSFDGTILMPEFKDRNKWSYNFAYDKQIAWELKAIDVADKIIFWIDRHLPDMPAFTTNTEFGYWIAKNPEKIILGIPKNSEKCDYIKYLAIENNIDIHYTFYKIVYQINKL